MHTLYLCTCASDVLYISHIRHSKYIKDWRGWDDFLGVILSFDEGRKIARELKGIDTEESYLELIKSKTISDDDLASRLPYRPDLKYKDEWLGWDDFLIG